MHRFRVGLSADSLNEDRKLVFPDIGLELLAHDAQIEYEFLADYRPDYEASQIAGYDVLISLHPWVRRSSVEGSTRLTAIGRCGVGCDNVDLDACTDNDIAVYVAREAVARPMAEAEVLLILALGHNLMVKDRAVRRGQWNEGKRVLGREPRERVIGTVGFGNIAREMVRLIRPFLPARILAYDPYAERVDALALGVEPVSLETLLRESDFVLINCPLTEETRGLIGAEQIRADEGAGVLHQRGSRSDCRRAGAD